MKKKIITLVLSFVMIVAALPCTISLANEDTMKSKSSAIIKRDLHSNSIRLASSDDVIEVKHNNTVDDIVAKAREIKHNGFSYSAQTQYESIPHLTSPYEAGAVKQDNLNDALNTLKMVRYLAGLPYENIVLDNHETLTAQHKAVLMAVSEYGHYPPQPSDMSDDFYNTAMDFSAECIYTGLSNISNSILGFVADHGDNNIEEAGHRMILLNPGAQRYGIGYAYSENVPWYDMIAVHVDYDWKEIDSYMAWPNAGDFPIQYFIAESDSDYEPPYPWSITLGSNYNMPDKENIQLQITRKRDNKVWFLNKDTPNLGNEGLDDRKMHLAVNGKDIVFRPDVSSLGCVKDGDIFNVNLTGIEYSNGTPAELSYDINFFDLEDALTKSKVTINVKHNGTAVSGATVKIDGQSLVTDSDGNASTRIKNNKSYNYTVSKNGYNTETDSITVGENAVTQNVSLTVPVTFTVSDTVKTYNATSQGVSVSANPKVEYKVTYNGSETAPQDAGTYNVSVVSNAAGYSGSETAKLTISKAAISVKADDRGKKIGNADPELTYTITSGQLYGDDKLTGTLSRKSGENIGTYKINQGTLSAGDNYAMSFTPGTFTILEKIPQDIKVSEITDKTYGDPSFKVNVTPDSVSGLTNFTYESDNTDVAEISSDGTVTIKNAGTANISVKQTGDADYAAFTRTQKLNVAKVQLTVTADNKYKKIGTDDPVLTYTYTGTLVGDDAFTGSLTRKAGESLGTYDILQGTLTVNESYDITYNKAVFEIVEKTPQNITVSAMPEKTYGDDGFKVEATPDNVSKLSEFTYESDNPNVAEISADGTVTIKGAGETNITVRQAGDDEYAAFAKTQKLLVSPKPVTISSVDLNNKTAVITGLLESDKSVSLDFNKLQLNDIAAVDESTSSANVSNFVLSNDGSINYKVETETLPATIKTENIVTINIVSSNGTVTGAGSYIKGSTIILTATPNSGYKFSGWVNGTDTVSSETNYTLTADESMELTAKFTRKSSGGGGGSSTYLIRFNTDGGNEISNQRVSRNSKIKEPTNPIKEGYEFGGWYSDAQLTKKYDFGTKVTANATLYAKWFEVNPEDSQIVLTIGKKEAKVFGKIKSNDVAPKIVNDRTMLPARFVAENLGANVEWFDDEQKVRITKDDIEILIYIGSDKARVNNKEVILDSPAFIENDRTYTPIRFISEELGATVEWDETTQEVTITQ